MKTRPGQHWIWLLIPLLVVLGFCIWLFWDLPSPHNLDNYTSTSSSIIYDRSGRVLFEFPPPFTGSHTPVPLSDIPVALQQATIAMEDKNFYTNPGFDLAGITRAVWYIISNEDVVMGGSTITQQLVRNLLFTPSERTEMSFRRKMRELTLAVLITQRYSKDEILEFYLNETYYGNLAYGVEAAAQSYFGKHVRDLDLAECALLASIPQAPALANPLENYDRAKLRQAIVLDRMVEEGYTTPEQSELAKNETLYLASVRFPIRAPHFVMYVRRYLEQELGLERLQSGGLHIHTTLDIDLNETIRDLMRYRLSLLAACNYKQDCPPGGYNVRNAAVIILSPQTGAVLAMVGSPDYFSARISGAVNGTTSLRQPGSAIKPITYAAAFEQGTMTPATMLLDIRTSYVTREGQPYVPLNYDLTFRGPVRLREALASSYNLIAVKVLDAIGVETMVNLAHRMGITTLDDPEKMGLALTLGGGEVSLLELATAYAVFANEGSYVSPRVVQYVDDANGNRLWTEPCLLGMQSCSDGLVLDSRVAYLISDILSDDTSRIPTFGEGSILNLTRPAAVKTGTTTDYRDNWTVGYTPNLVTGVWVGNADNESMQYLTSTSGAGGITGAAPLWHDVMEIALSKMPVEDFTRPAGMVESEVCAVSGKLPSPSCPHRILEVFIAGTEPQDICDMHQLIEGQTYLLLPPEAASWAVEHNIPQPPESLLLPASDEGILVLTRPDQGVTYQLDTTVPPEVQKIEISAVARENFTQVELLLNGKLLSIHTQPPYTTFWQLEAGEHVIIAAGTTESGVIVWSEPVHIEVYPP
jgi:1A family penicillin-binding protein